MIWMLSASSRSRCVKVVIACRSLPSLSIVADSSGPSIEMVDRNRTEGNRRWRRGARLTPHKRCGTRGLRLDLHESGKLLTQPDRRSDILLVGTGLSRSQKGATPCENQDIS